LIDNPNVFTQQLPHITKPHQPMVKQLLSVGLTPEAIKSSEQYRRLLLEIEKSAQ